MKLSETLRKEILEAIKVRETEETIARAETSDDDELIGIMLLALYEQL